jgi:uncharacterized protein (TIGR01370 family)
LTTPSLSLRSCISQAIAPAGLTLGILLAGCGGGGGGGNVTGGTTGTPALQAAVSTQGNFTSGEMNATYTITVTNSGSGTTSGTVTLVDPPTGFTVTAISGAGWTCTLSTLTCTRGDSLAAGASYPAITVTGNVTAANGTLVSIPLTLSGGGITSAVTSTPTIAVAAPALSITKSHTGDFNAGQQGTYTVTVQNGASAGATSAKVTVTETVPSGETLVSMAGTGWTCPGTGGASTCDRSDSLATGGAYPTITVTVNVGSGATSPQVNQVSVSGGGMTSPVSTTDSTTINLAPTVNFSVNPSSITLGASANLSWSSTNAASCTSSGAWSETIATSGTQGVTPTAASLSIPGFLTYTLTCQNSAGVTVTGNAVLTVTYPTPTGPLANVRSFVITQSGGVDDPDGEGSLVTNSLADLVTVGNSNTEVLNKAVVDPTGSKLILGYTDAVEATSYLEPSLFTGSSLPSWFGNQDPGFPGSYSVQYWNPAWETALFATIDETFANGYDGIWIDGLDGDLEWSAGNAEGNPVYPDAVSAMATLMTDIRNHVNTTYPGKTFYLIGNNPTNVATADPSALKSLDVIFNEVAYYQHSGFWGNVAAGWITSTLAPVYATAGVPIFGNDYPQPLSDSSASLLSFELYSSVGWIPSVTNPSDTDAIFSTGPFMFTATPGNSTVTGYPNFVNFLSGGLAPNATLTGGDMGDYFIGGPGQNTITGGAGNDTIYAHPANAASKGALLLDLEDALFGTASTPSVSVQLNGNQVIPSTAITALYGSTGTTPQRLQVSVPNSISSVQLTVTNTSYTNSNNTSALYIVDIIYNGVPINLGLGVYSNGQGPPYPYSGDGTVTFPGSAFAVVPQFPANTSDVIDGGGGTNTVVYRGPSSNYTVTQQSDGSWLVTSAATAEGPDTLTNIQVLQFSDTQTTLQ